MAKGFGLGNLMQQAQKMQAEISKVQEEMASRTIEVTSGGGMVRVVANGRQEIISITVEPEVLEGGDREMLQDLIVAAVNQALTQSREMVMEEMRKVTGGIGINIPGLV